MDNDGSPPSFVLTIDLKVVSAMIVAGAIFALLFVMAATGGLDGM